MSKQENAVQTNPAQVVYIVQRWNTIVAVYANFNDAAQVVQASIAKGQVCDIIAKVVQ